MKHFLYAMFSESTEISESRVLAFLVTLAGVAVVIVGMCKSTIDYGGISMLSGTLFGIAFTGKVTSKYAEVADKKATVKTTEVKN